MYLLSQDDVIHPDGTTATSLPLTLSLGEGASAVVAFGTPQTARAFLRRFPMGPDYRVVPFSRIPRTKLHVTDHVCDAVYRGVPRLHRSRKAITVVADDVADPVYA